mmetsp:Transcript_7251/g.22103  ORF Transcript_7251/g.22103 Transcript_7251/m.22103 type:complete len:336 (-) Transcript_7251:70-1077(-)
MPGLQSLALFGLVLLIALGTNPDEESFERFAHSRFRGFGEMKHGCSARGICLHGGTFARILEPVNSMSKRVLGFRQANHSSRLHFRGTDCVFFTVVHGIGSWSGAYLGIFDMWIALPHPKLLQEAAPDFLVALSALPQRLRALDKRQRSLPFESASAALYGASTATYALAPQLFVERLLWSRAALRRGRFWTILFSFFAHRSTAAAIRSVAVLSFFGPALSKYSRSAVVWCSIIIGGAVALTLATIEASAEQPIFLGPVVAYSILVSLCVTRSQYAVKLSSVSVSGLHLHPFDALVLCIISDFPRTTAVDAVAAVGAGIGSWLVTRGAELLTTVA